MSDLTSSATPQGRNRPPGTTGPAIPAAPPPETRDAGHLPEPADAEPGAPAPRERPCLGRPRARRLAQPAEPPRRPLTATQRLLILDAWRRSGLPAGDFAPLVGISKHTLYSWKKRFDAQGPAGLDDQPRGAPAGSRLPEVTRRAILMMKEANPDWGVERISALLLRGPALPASPQAVARVLHEAGYGTEEIPTHPHPDHVRRFERARPNQLWQTDLFTFVFDQPS